MPTLTEIAVHTFLSFVGLIDADSEIGQSSFGLTFSCSWPVKLQTLEELELDHS
jgi:hypothetical protein